MRILTPFEMNQVSGGGTVNFDVRPDLKPPFDATPPSDPDHDLPGNRVGWCWGLGNLGGSAGEGRGLKGGANAPTHKEHACPDLS